MSSSGASANAQKEKDVKATSHRCVPSQASTPEQALALREALRSVPEDRIWLAAYASPHTRAAYGAALRDFQNLFGIRETRDYAEINASHIVMWRETMVRRGFSGATIRTRLAAISKLFRHLAGRQLVRENPASSVERPKATRSRTKRSAFTTRQGGALLDAPDRDNLKGLRDYAILQVFLFTGARISEICRLRVRDFYEDQGYNVLRFLRKGGKEGVLAIHQECVNAIRAYLDASRHGVDPAAPLFLPFTPGFRRNRDPDTAARQHLSRQQLANLFARYRRAAGLASSIVPHSARATFITTALDAGVPIELVKEAAGHADVSTTSMYDHRTRRHAESPSLRVLYPRKGDNRS